VPDGAIIKPSAANARPQARARAVVFENIEDFHRRSTIRTRYQREEREVLKNCGPKAIPAWPSRQHALPPKLLKKGITEQWCVSRMRA